MWALYQPASDSLILVKASMLTKVILHKIIGRSLWYCLLAIKRVTECIYFCREQGMPGLYKGLEAKLTQTVLMGALMFLTYEKIAAVVFKVMRAEIEARKEME